MSLGRKHLPLQLVVALVVVGLVAWQGVERWQGRCEAGAGELLAAGDLADGAGLPLVPADELDPDQPYDDGSVPSGRPLAERRAALADLPAIGGPVGELEAGFWTGGLLADPVLLAADGDAVEVGQGDLPGTDEQGWLAGVDLPSGELAWALGYGDDSAPGGGLVDGRLVTLDQPDEGRLRLLAYDAGSGEEVACARLTDDFEAPFDATRDVDVIDEAALVVHESPDDVQLTRVDLDGGGTDFQEEVGLASVESLRAVGDLAVLSQVDVTSFAGPGELRERAVALAAGQEDRPPAQVEARDATDGELEWTFPAGEPGVAGVLGVDEESGMALLALMVGGDPYGLEPGREVPPEEVTTSLVAVVPNGDPVWQEETASVNAAVWGDLAVVAVPGDDATVLRAYSLADGSRAWETTLPGPAQEVVLADAEEVDGTWLLPFHAAPALLLVDPATGAVERRGTGMVLADLDVTDEHVVLTGSGGVFVLARR